MLAYLSLCRRVDFAICFTNGKLPSISVLQGHIQICFKVTELTLSCFKFLCK